MSPVPPGFSFLISFSDICSYCFKAVRNREREIKKGKSKLFTVSSISHKSFHEPLRKEQTIFYRELLTTRVSLLQQSACSVSLPTGSWRLLLWWGWHWDQGLKVHGLKLVPISLNKHQHWHNLEQSGGCARSVEQHPDCPTARTGTGSTFSILPLGGIRGICQAQGMSQA